MSDTLVVEVDDKSDTELMNENTARLARFLHDIAVEQNEMAVGCVRSRYLQAT